MKDFLKDHPELARWLITALCSLLGVGGIGGGMWHHHNKYHGHDHDKAQMEQSQKHEMSSAEIKSKLDKEWKKVDSICDKSIKDRYSYKMSDDETRLKIQQDMEERGHK